MTGTEEAREAAVKAIPFHANRGFAIVRESERRRGFEEGYSSGVREGIRRAKAIVEAGRPEMGPHILVTEYRSGRGDALTDALAAIDALEANR